MKLKSKYNVGDVVLFYNHKICDNDKAKGRTPKWTNRQVPEFYKKEMMKSE